MVILVKLGVGDRFMCGSSGDGRLFSAKVVRRRGDPSSAAWHGRRPATTYGDFRSAQQYKPPRLGEFNGLGGALPAAGCVAARRPRATSEPLALPRDHWSRLYRAPPPFFHWPKFFVDMTFRFRLLCGPHSALRIPNRAAHVRFQLATAAAANARRAERVSRRGAGGPNLLHGHRDCMGRWEALAPHLPQAGTILDVGSNFGWFGLQICRTRPQCVVASVEADLRSAAVQRQVLQSHDATRICLLTARAGRPMIGASGRRPATSRPCSACRCCIGSPVIANCWKRWGPSAAGC